MRRAGTAFTAILLLAAAWGSARLLSAGDATPAPADPYALSLRDLPESPTATQLRVAANVAFGLLLTDGDIRAWRRWTAEGTAPAEALRRVLAYRRAAEP